MNIDSRSYSSSAANRYHTATRTTKSSWNVATSIPSMPTSTNVTRSVCATHPVQRTNRREPSIRIARPPCIPFLSLCQITFRFRKRHGIALLFPTGVIAARVSLCEVQQFTANRIRFSRGAFDRPLHPDTTLLTTQCGRLKWRFPCHVR
jgi:hypothetical protein